MSEHKFYGRKPFFILLIPVLLFGLSWVVMTLWNEILPGVLHVGMITYWQAMGILVLSRLLFGGKPGGWGGRRGEHHRQKWMNMSEDEREKFKSEWKSRWGRK